MYFLGLGSPLVPLGLLEQHSKRQETTIIYIIRYNNKTSMERKDYQEPTMQIVEVKQKCSLLAGSNSSAANINVIFSEEDWINE